MKSSPIYANHYFARQFFAYFNESQISVECRTVAAYVADHQNDDWALKLIDSSGVVGAGLAKGNYQFMGDFDECLDVKVTLSGDRQITGITGQYCTLNIPVETLVGNNESKHSTLNVESLHLTPTLGICIPNACNIRDLTNILTTFSLKTNINVTVSDCTDPNENNIKWYHIFIISAFATILVLIFIGTFIDVTNIFRQKSSVKLVTTLKAFSLYTNTEQLLSTGSQKETISCFHGFRVISLCFIIIYHIWTEAQLPSGFKSHLNH
ncbi:nose resistant to fluoxetine protein 6-like [Oppia nitens]|uniref:nose resistant to fluoxetine protein 6-like n=1 Tax=Oppia nitens TaxID=1686743 RepID=UPI0023DB878E|nr:nose resistant to fluoxetine protein 6-like [Oppia nitens]